MGDVGPFPGSKAWPGSDADYSPPSNAEEKKVYEIYTSNSSPPSACMVSSGTALLLLLLFWFILRMEMVKSNIK
jgi:hypothetical protein